MRIDYFAIIFFLFFLAVSCQKPTEDTAPDALAFVGGNIIDGTGRQPISNGVLLVRDGRVAGVGTQADVELPENTEVIDLKGKTVIPGLINTHAHVNFVSHKQADSDTTHNLVDQLALYARYGITTVVSLGEDHQKGAPLREAVDTTTTRDRARFYVAGAVVTGETPEEAVAVVDRNVKMGVDFIKIRVDDQLGTTSKMPQEIYQAVIDRSHEHQLKLAAHMYYLEDAKRLLEAGADFLAHSVRDQVVDTELIQLLKEKNVCYCPTLTREVSTFVYEEVPDFFDDPFFLREADTVELAALKDPQRQQQIKNSQSAQTYKQALPTALANLKILSDSSVTIAMGTDSGVPTRFQGYFEHLEMELMAEAGMSPMQIIVAATKDAAACLGLPDIGTLENGKWADFIILDEDPLADIKNTRSISSVWIGGQPIER